jgi:two-component system LytT family sensor kinase
MEFDNDKIIKPSYRIEIFYWLFLALINPFVNGVTLFLKGIHLWPVLLLVNLIIFPLYLLYARFMVPRLLFKKKYPFYILSIIVLFFVVHIVLLAIYSFFLQFDILPDERIFFTYNSATVLRESLWIVINTSIATAIGFVREALEEKDALADLQKDSNFFKLRYLRAQLNPHFLFNTLNSIYALSLQKSDKAPDIVVKLADIMRYLIYECNEERIPLNKEIEFIRNYIEIEQIRHKADIRFSVEGETDNVLIEPFIFISFIENGFKHALDNAFVTPFIYITLKIEEKQLVLNVLNNTNIDLETQAKRIHGKGITTSKSLLEILYPDSHELDIIQTEKEERQQTELRLKHAKDRLEKLYQDGHTLDVILNNNTFTVSLILKRRAA